MSERVRGFQFDLRFIILSLAVFLFNNWILGLILSPRLLINGATVSQLSATTQPYHLIFRTLDISSGLLLILSALLVYKSMQHSRALRIFVWSTLVLGIADIFDALLPLSCSEVADAHCTSPQGFIFSHLLSQHHLFSSIPIAITYLLLPISGLMYAKHFKNPVAARITQVLSITVILVTIASFVLAITSYLLPSNFAIEKSFAYLQEFQMLLLAGWFIYWFLAVMRNLSPSTNLHKSKLA